MSKRALALLGSLTVALAACSEAPKGDPAHGAQIHEVCLDCHGTGLYVKPDRKVKSLEHLHKETMRWGDYYNPALSPQDIDDVVAYLNRDFYHFR
jgi:mono/diheme cytochrome c family protein